MENDSLSYEKKKASSLSHVPPLKEKALSLSCMEVCSIRCSIRGHRPSSLDGLQEHVSRGQCISSCYSRRLQHRESQEEKSQVEGAVMVEVMHILS